MLPVSGVLIRGFRVTSVDWFQWIRTSLSTQSSMNITALLRQSISNISRIIYPTGSTIFSPPVARLSSQTASFFLYTRAPSFCPGGSSLDLGHGGVVLGQDLHQLVSPVKRVPEPAQLSRDLHGGGDLCGKTDRVKTGGTPRVDLRGKKKKSAESDTHPSSPF